MESVFIKKKLLQTKVAVISDDNHSDVQFFFFFFLRVGSIKTHSYNYRGKKGKHNPIIARNAAL